MWYKLLIFFQWWNVSFYKKTLSSVLNSAIYRSNTLSHEHKLVEIGGYNDIANPGISIVCGNGRCILVTSSDGNSASVWQCSLYTWWEDVKCLRYLSSQQYHTTAEFAMAEVSLEWHFRVPHHPTWFVGISEGEINHDVVKQLPVIRGRVDHWENVKIKHLSLMNKQTYLYSPLRIQKMNILVFEWNKSW